MKGKETWKNIAKFSSLNKSELLIYKEETKVIRKWPVTEK
jgi:hypothetical protein